MDLFLKSAINNSISFCNVEFVSYIGLGPKYSQANVDGHMRRTAHEPSIIELKCHSYSTQQLTQKTLTLMMNSDPSLNQV